MPVSRLGAPIDGRRGTNRGEPSGSPLSPARARATILLLLKPFGLALSVVMPARCTLTIEPSPGPPKTLHIRVLSKPPSRPFPGPPFIEATSCTPTTTGSRRIAALPGAALHRGVYGAGVRMDKAGPSRPFPGPPFIEARSGAAPCPRSCIAALPGAALHRGEMDKRLKASRPRHRGPSRGRPSSRPRLLGDVGQERHDRGPSRGRPSSRQGPRRAAQGCSRGSRPFPGPPFIEASRWIATTPAPPNRGPSRGRPSSRHAQVHAVPRPGRIAALPGAALHRGASTLPCPSTYRAIAALPGAALHRGNGFGPADRTELRSRPFPGPPFIEAGETGRRRGWGRRSRPFPGPGFA